MSERLPKPAKSRGRVTLVGAGPGDPELLTLKAVNALQSADVILFDALVSEEVLELAKAKAKRLLVGKRGHRTSCRQEDINELMLKLARQGKHVVRLKSGNSVIFGRAGEEIEILEAAGIEVSIVPGITSASAMAAAICTSLTHRDFAHSVRFVTGHSRDGTLPRGLDWRGLAAPDTTLVVYMGGRTAGALADKLIGEGLAPGTPAVALSSVTRPDQTVWRGTLGELAAGVNFSELHQPVVIGIGHVFAARKSQAETVTGQLIHASASAVRVRSRA